MSLLELRVDNVRCIEDAELQLHPGQNLIWGGNGSGKTSLLEGIFLLGRGRSFRTRNSERLIRYGQERLVVFGRVGHETAVRRSIQGSPSESSKQQRDLATAVDQQPNRLEPGVGNRGPALGEGFVSDGGAIGRQGVEGDVTAIAPAQGERWAEGTSGLPEWGADLLGTGLSVGVQVSRNEGTVARIGGTPTKSLTELTQLFPVQVIDPGIHKLVEEGSNRRRRWLDWGVFHVEPQFGDWWLRYTRAVKQRNAALRSHPPQAAAWDPEVAKLGVLISESRRRFVEGLLPYWQESVFALCGLEPELQYFQGWAQDVPLAEALQASRVRDEAKRLTHVGPHRADLLIRINGRTAREVFSRGQQKLVAVAMTLAQLNLLQEATQTTPTLLLDDPAAELDEHHLGRLIEQVLRLRSQLILTSLHPESRLFGTPDRVFHVEQGRVPRYNALS